MLTTKKGRTRIGRKNLSSAAVAKEGGSTDNKRKMPSLSDTDVPLLLLLLLFDYTITQGWPSASFPRQTTAQPMMMSQSQAKVCYSGSPRDQSRRGSRFILMKVFGPTDWGRF